MITLDDYYVKGVKTFRGHEGLGYNATLYRGNKKVAFVYDDASGGELAIEWQDYKEPKVSINGKSPYKDEARTYKGTPEEKILQELVNELPPEKTDFGQVTVDIAIFVDGLVSNYEETKQLKKWCKTKTLFRLKGDKEGEWRTIKNQFCDRVKNYITKTYGNELLEIANERV